MSDLFADVPPLPPGVTERLEPFRREDGWEKASVRWEWPGGGAFHCRFTESAARAACRADYERAMGGAS